MRNTPPAHAFLVIFLTGFAGALAVGQDAAGGIEQKHLKATTLLFEKEKSDLDQRAESLLDQFISQSQGRDDVAFLIRGYSSSEGPPDLNRRLSGERAKAVKSYLIEKYGIKPEEIYAVALGDFEPITSNDTEEGRSQNRRVEVSIEKKSSLELLHRFAILQMFQMHTDLGYLELESLPELALLEVPTASSHIPVENGSINIVKDPPPVFSEGVILFNPASEMTVGRWTTVEVLISKDFSEDILKQFKESTPPQKEAIKISTVMRVSLLAADKDDFNIVLAGDDKGVIRAVDIKGGPPTKWEWFVKPLRSGQRTLRLTAEAMVTSGEPGSIPRFVETFSRDVRVKSDYVYSAKEALRSYWQFFASAVIIPLFIYTWNTLKSRRENRRKQNENNERKIGPRFE